MDNVWVSRTETALWLLKNDEILGDLLDNKGRSCLQLLANMPSAFKSGYPMDKFKSFIYFCLPSNEHDADKVDQTNLRQRNDLESGQGKNHLLLSCSLSFSRGWPIIGSIQNQKKKYESSWKLAKLLIKKDKSWKNTDIKPDIGIISFGETEGSGSEKKIVLGKKEDKEEKDDIIPPPLFLTNATPLLIATSTGIEEIVNGILDEYPQAVEHVSDQGLSIMHVAIRHRQGNIFERVRKMKIPMARLVRRIDDNGYTLLHHVADMTHYSSGNLPNPALQLQDELKWFERVRKLIPSHYVMNHSKGGQTAPDFFEKSHAYLLQEAQNWLKRTSESCSVIAVLIATVAFTVAYTVPGGFDSTGLPILHHHPFFVVFTITDVLALVSSLTSVVMFISILTSPFRLQDFRKSLPRKLSLAFTFLFLSVAATMMAFSTTVILIVRLQKRWTTTLIYGVAFVPVTLFALLQFPVYVAFMGTAKQSLSIMKKALPRNFLREMIGKNQ
ncbi:ankyrin repeat-containing protein ITN1-like [Ziziphus jujuba]|uniref:Ankyrin repeat-containing protein ITN1-like n=1 Tax=Ziziphus jujuba TaxID=326968 RepID=A0ABM4AAU8_ZIZJJ|nr:ankyrin repeat-containing protein ITN1-like [Ziziphus jujuba]